MQAYRFNGDNKPDIYGLSSEGKTQKSLTKRSAAVLSSLGLVEK